MREIILNKEDIEKTIELFNSKGRTAAETYLKETCDIKFTTFQRKIKKDTIYQFNRSNKKYEKIPDKNNCFLTMTDLCKEKQLEEKSSNSNSKEDIIIDLIKDRFNELCKYIHIEQSTKNILINQKLLELDGYTVVIQ